MARWKWRELSNTKYGAARFTTFLSCMHKLWHPGKMSFSILCYYYVIEIDNVGRFFHLQHRVIYTWIDSSQPPLVPWLVKSLKIFRKNSFWVWTYLWSNPESRHMYIVYIQPDLTLFWQTWPKLDLWWLFGWTTDPF